ncbi:hypothetical protein WDZ92_16850 [Nostoc sp. NIES-2111]
MIALLFWLLALSIPFVSIPTATTIMLSSIPFGSLAMLPPGAVGGLTILPYTIFAFIFIGRMLLAPRVRAGMLDLARRPMALGFYSLFLLYVVMAAFIMPRLFSGQILIFPVRGLVHDTAPLRFTSSNISQLGYLLVTSGLLYSFAALAALQDMRTALLRGLLVAAGVVALTGLLDFVLGTLGRGYLLEPFRTASYALLTEVQVGGEKRTVGLMPEASAYAQMGVPFLAALYLLQPFVKDERIKNFYCRPLILVLFFLIFTARSSTGYLGLGMVLALIAASWFLDVLERKGVSVSTATVIEVSFITLSVVLIVSLILSNAKLIDSIANTIDYFVFQKTSSGSYKERSMWNTVSFEAMMKTYGLGLGPGSTRTSSWPVALMAAGGFIGAAFFAVFLLTTFLAGGTSLEQRPLIRRLKLIVATNLATYSLVAVGVDYGAFAGIVLGTIVGLRYRRMAPRPTPTLVPVWMASPRLTDGRRGL